MKSILVIIILISSSIAKGENRFISVEGLVEKSFKPNLININLLIWGKGSNATDAQKNQIAEAIRVKKIIKSFNIEDNEIQTSAYDLNPDYIYDQKTNQNKMEGYHANESILIILKNIENAGKLIDSISGPSVKFSGLNINSINWDIKNREELQKSLLSEAVEDALSKAEILAKAAHVKIKNVFHITPGNSSRQAPQVAYMKSFGGGSADSNPQTQLQSGVVKIINSVSIDYEIE